MGSYSLIIETLSRRLGDVWKVKFLCWFTNIYQTVTFQVKLRKLTGFNVSGYHGKDRSSIAAEVPGALAYLQNFHSVASMPVIVNLSSLSQFC